MGCDWVGWDGMGWYSMGSGVIERDGVGGTVCDWMQRGGTWWDVNGWDEMECGVSGDF